MTNRYGGEDPHDKDEFFRILLKNYKKKQADADKVKQAAIEAPRQLTDQEIDERMARMDIIQQDVKNGTYHDPNKIYHKVYGWVEYGDKGMPWPPADSTDTTNVKQAAITERPSRCIRIGMMPSFARGRIQQH